MLARAAERGERGAGEEARAGGSRRLEFGSYFKNVASRKIEDRLGGGLTWKTQRISFGRLDWVYDIVSAYDI